MTTNIQIRKNDNEPFICDFGLGHGITQSALSMLTPGERHGVQRWSPPERAFPKRGVTEAGDVWSLASTLLELLTGKAIWPDIETDYELIDRLKQDDVMPDLINDVEDEELRDVLKSCFTKETSKRPTAKEVADKFRKVLKDLQ